MIDDDDGLAAIVERLWNHFVEIRRVQGMGQPASKIWFLLSRHAPFNPPPRPGKQNRREPQRLRRKTRTPARRPHDRLGNESLAVQRAGKNLSVVEELLIGARPVRGRTGLLRCTQEFVPRLRRFAGSRRRLPGHHRRDKRRGRGHARAQRDAGAREDGEQGARALLFLAGDGSNLLDEIRRCPARDAHAKIFVRDSFLPNGSRPSGQANSLS